MNSYKVFMLLIFLPLLNQAFSQVNPDYEIIYLGGPYKEILALNPAKQWYLVAHTKDQFDQDLDKIISINTTKDLNWEWNKKDSTYSLKPDGAVRKYKGRYLIGTYDTLREWEHRVMSWTGLHKTQGSLIIGEMYDVNLQGFRDCSPYVSLCVTGKTIIETYYPEVVEYELVVTCVSNPIAYHSTTNLGGKEFEEEQYFKQFLNPLVEEYNQQREGIDSTGDFKYAYLMYTGYIDKDYLLDFIINIEGRNYLFLTYQHDLDKGKVFHIEKAWKDVRVFEF